MTKFGIGQEWRPNRAIIGAYHIPMPASGARCISAMSAGRLFFARHDIGLVGKIIILTVNGV